MNKAEAITLLGGTNASAARAIGITPAAVSQWPDELPARIADRVLAACHRMEEAAARDSEQRETAEQGAPP
jgi:DNA-binding transcriptional regulator YdaS (Cro superfamily)